MRIQREVTPPGFKGGRIWRTEKARRNVTVAKWTLRGVRSDLRRIMAPGKLPAFRLATATR